MKFKNELDKKPLDHKYPYDERSGDFVNKGSHYGVGHKQPVGHKGTAKATSDMMPMKTGKINEKS
jgi:hypothetical protein